MATTEDVSGGPGPLKKDPLNLAEGRVTEGRRILDALFSGPALLPSAIALAVIFSEGITVAMSLILRGHVDSDFVITGFVASLVVATVISALIKFMKEREAALERDNAIQAALIEELRRQEAELRIGAAAFESREPKFLLDERGRIVKINRALVSALGFTESELVGSEPTFLGGITMNAGRPALPVGTDEGDAGWQGEVLVIRASGDRFKALLTISDVLDEAGNATHRVAGLFDLTERLESLAAIHRLSFFDALTGLPNLNGLKERVKALIPSIGRSASLSALALFDLDGFSAINQAGGTAAGDEVLRESARRLSARARESDALARIAADEFCLFMNGVGSDPREAAANIEKAVNELLESLTRPYAAGEDSYRRTWSVGVTLVDGEGRDVEALLQEAQAALRKAKAAGGSGLRFFDRAMQDAMVARLRMESDLRGALENGELSLYYQAQVGGDGDVRGAECLLRWRHPTRGMVPPGEFIPIAEESGLILPIGRRVIEEACAALARLPERVGGKPLSLSVNISPRQFMDPGFTDHLIAAAKAGGAEPRRLRLEITESLMQSDASGTRSIMEAARAAGFSFAMDDFGTGFSSLSLLQDMRFEELKIDQSFIRKLDAEAAEPEAGSARALTGAIVAMGHSLQMEVVAEGVETESQRAFLSSLGCDLIQGYLTGKPVPLDEFILGFSAGGVSIGHESSEALGPNGVRP